MDCPGSGGDDSDGSVVGSSCDYYGSSGITDCSGNCIWEAYGYYYDYYDYFGYGYYGWVNDGWCDDPASELYNQFIKTPYIA